MCPQPSIIFSTLFLIPQSQLLFTFQPHCCNSSPAAVYQKNENFSHFLSFPLKVFPSNIMGLCSSRNRLWVYVIISWWYYWFHDSVIASTILLIANRFSCIFFVLMKLSTFSWYYIKFLPLTLLRGYRNCCMIVLLYITVSSVTWYCLKFESSLSCFSRGKNCPEEVCVWWSNGTWKVMERVKCEREV